MNLLLKAFFLGLIVSQSFAQGPYFQDKKWILWTERIEKGDFFLERYSPAKLKSDSFIIRFLAGGKIDYDYESNPHAKPSKKTEFLDIDTNLSRWEFDSDLNVLILSLKGGYKSLEDFNFKAVYSPFGVNGGFIMRRVSEENFQKMKDIVAAPMTVPAVLTEASNKPVKISAVVLVSETKEVEKSPVKEEVKVVSKEEILAARNAELLAQSKFLLTETKRWILLTNKITKNVVRFTSFDRSKFRINTLVLSFVDGGKIAYDYEMDPTLEFCAGIDFLDIDTDESAWSLDEENNVLTLTLKGGYASLDDFKFKRDYKIQQTGDEYVLHKIKEHYFIDLKKENQKNRKKAE